MPRLGTKPKNKKPVHQRAPRSASFLGSVKSANAARLDRWLSVAVAGLCGRVSEAALHILARRRSTGEHRKLLIGFNRFCRADGAKVNLGATGLLTFVKPTSGFHIAWLGMTSRGWMRMVTASCRHIADPYPPHLRCRFAGGSTMPSPGCRYSFEVVPQRTG
jgi:hypothetical protein